MNGGPGMTPRFAMNFAPHLGILRPDRPLFINHAGPDPIEGGDHAAASSSMANLRTDRKRSGAATSTP